MRRSTWNLVPEHQLDGRAPWCSSDPLTSMTLRLSAETRASRLLVRSYDRANAPTAHEQSEAPDKGC